MDGVNTGTASRIHGLDTLRALAVALVVLHHYTLFVSDAPTFGWVGTMGWAGVDLFFALSGYLIGNQIFAALGSARGLSLGRFYGRRLLRTLPNFWVVLALYALWPAWRGDTPYLARLRPGEAPAWVTGPPAPGDLDTWARPAAAPASHLLPKARP